MKILTFKNLFYPVLLSLFLTINSYSQDENTTLNQDPKFEQLLNEKRKINSSITINDRYKVQIYTGDSETSRNTLSEFRRNFDNFDGTIVFSTPYYKVWVGNFKTRIEAERNLQDLKKFYANAFLIKPNK